MITTDQEDNVMNRQPKLARTIGKLTAVSTIASLATVAYAFSWGTPVQITGYYVYAGGTAYITTTSNQNPDSCTHSSYLAIDTTQSNFRAMWAQVLAAHAAGQTVSINYNGRLGAYPNINAIAAPNIW
jgi:hypothetical protein